MKRLFLILFTALSSFAYSQAHDEVEEIMVEVEQYICDYKNFDFEVLKSTGFNNGKLKAGTGVLDAYKTYSREIDNELIDDCYYVMFYSEYLIDYYIHILSREGMPIGVLYKIAFSDFEAKSCYDENKINEFISWHNEYYNTKSTVDDFIEGITDTRFYSYHCGYSGHGTNVPEYQGEEFTVADIDVFRSWVASYSLEIQNYGYDALNHLKKKAKVKLSKADKKILRHIKKRNSVINFCHGCLAGIYEKRF